MSDDRSLDERQAPERGRDAGLTTATLAGAGAEPSSQGRPPPGEERSEGPSSAPLFPDSETQDLKSEWDRVQASFVDEPRRAVEQADGLVASAMKRLAEIFADERSRLEAQWDRGDDVSTEDLRVALQRYRSFFARLLSM